jgi:hypothetical protein
MGEEGLANAPYVNADSAVACLTSAWFHALRIRATQRGDVVEQIERALESAARLRDNLRA